MPDTNLMREVPQPLRHLVVVGFAIGWLVLAQPIQADVRPMAPIVTDDGAISTTASQLHATWVVSKQADHITEYQYLIAQNAPAVSSAVISWTSTGAATSVTRTGLSLAPGRTYYVAVRARNRSGAWSAVGYSDGITVNLPPEVRVVSVGWAAGGSRVILDGSQSRDPEGASLRYAWRQLSGPVIALADASSATASFAAPYLAHNAGMSFELTASDQVSATSGATALTVQQVAAPTASISASSLTVAAGVPFMLTVGGTSPAGLAAVWWWGEDTGVTNATVTLNLPESPTSTEIFTMPVVNPTKLDRAFGSPLFSAAQAVTGYTFTAEVTIAQPGTYRFGANSRDVFYAIPGEAHQASEGMGIPYLNVTVISDTQAPQLGLIGVSGITATSVVISWTTDEPATSQVDYGQTPAYGQTTPLDTALVMSHSVTLTGLSGLETYHVRVRSADAVGNVAQSGDTSFKTLSPGPSLVSVSGRQLMVQKRNLDGTLQSASPYIIRGVVWSPASQGTNTSPSDINNVVVRRPEFGNWYLTDIPLMKAMNVNTVRVMMDLGLPGDPNLAVPGLDILDELYRNGIMVIMTVDDANNNMNRIQQAVPHYRDHPAILMWLLGNEWNIFCYYRVLSEQSCSGFTLSMAVADTEEAAQLVQGLDANHPVATSYGEIDIDRTGKRLADTQRYVNIDVPSVDVWGLNIYRRKGAAFRLLFSQWASITTKPMFLGEFGVDAFHATATTNPDPPGAVHEPEQAQWDQGLWDDIHRNLSANNSANVALGGAAFEWNDEWWKVFPAGSQQTNGWFSSAFPDGMGNEEYFGIADINRSPRQVHGSLTTAFHPAYVTPSPVVVTYEAVSEGADVPTGPTYGFAQFKHDGASFYYEEGGGQGGRGFNVAVIDPTTATLVDPGRNFDTWGSRNNGTAHNALMAHLNSQPNGALLLIAIGDEGGLTEWGGDGCTRLFAIGSTVEQVYQALEALGSTQIRSYCYGDSWSLVTVKGEGVARDEALGKAVPAVTDTTVSIP